MVNIPQPTSLIALASLGFLTIPFTFRFSTAITWFSNSQIICIDGSRFSDPSNPALQIYTALKKAGCPASPDGKTRTIAELQAYCEDDLSEEKIALIFYEAPTDPPPQGFDMAVLNQLARFSHPPIAVVVGDRLPECRLPQFLESDPDLIANILQWLHNLER
ncbi:hypothetical protein K4A83_06445 [Spirulina subsalsa FACHB-351]|uniref:NACHT C-terminal Alpha/Beta domain-containing protein n=1 Tax=Spirulina subsalsa FACHB-351 TaxID=234711 RepID=A0ABT3L325_9CYAN|nr:hypothetical protein [Spirulina subsalsa]MCW6035911.1 hypothetical protein [Spirulina subsalsa FACHB-351]